MRIFRLFAALLAWYSLGCSSAPPVCSGGTGGSVGGTSFFDSGEVQDDAFVAGRPRTFWVTMPEQCTDAIPEATSVSVTDGNLQAVAASAVLEKFNFSYRANITFTPPREGAYHLAVSFEPNFGLVQRDLLAGAPRDDVQTQSASLTRGGCVGFAVTQLGSMVCRRELGAASTVVRPGRPEETLDAHTLSVAGNTVWVDYQGKVTRYVDDGTQLVKTDGPYSLPKGTESLLAADDAFVWFADRAQPSSVTQLDRSGQGTPHSLPAIFSDAGNGEIHYALTSEGALLLGIFPNDDERPNLCRIEPKAGTAPRCVRASNELIGADSKGFWLIDLPAALGSMRTLEHVTIDAEGPLLPRVTRTLLPPNFPIVSEGVQSLQSAFVGAKVPVFGIGTVPAQQGANIVFEVWPAPAGADLTLAYEDAVFSFGTQTPFPLHVRKRQQ
ncbi:MAG: hypothetical protein K1X64_12610 [Myxococcaceae bacterium]|nr:hypothetical protein [Myxococcaceae bacterium]